MGTMKTSATKIKKPKAPKIYNGSNAHEVGDLVTFIRKFDIILANTSGGKDSQTTLGQVANLATAAGVKDRVVALHADLGRVEWAGTKALAKEQAEAYGVRFEVAATRPKGDLLYQIEHQRKMFPGRGTRFCTSDHKRAQCQKVLTRLVDEFKKANPKHKGRVKVLNCLGFRFEEGKRDKELAYVPVQESGWTNKTKRVVTRWLPIHGWTESQVWADIHASGVRYHDAYRMGMPRLSCVFCIYAKRDAIMIAGEKNPALLDEYVRVEKKIGHQFQVDFSIASIKEALDRGERGDPNLAAFADGL
jgi:3'-phosphoadenosine 5'-phosphosulfate sulfotransferase (PAPS reductase)/FAD synthetase